MKDACALPTHPKCGPPACSYTYRNESGKPVLIANRYNRKDGKFFLPFDVLRSEWKAPVARPLYNLDKIINADPTQAVIFVEGEKCADALAGLGFLTTTSFGGCKALSKTDLTPLANRPVTIWPDYDDAGESYANSLKAALNNIGNFRTFQVTISP
ncbi:MAG: hypothetical protein ABJM82_18040 [Shimia thalassica]|uniref:hypothetical protein n=1 Tax=Rhodobacterales TaxID=204455 RepID=UPI003299E9A8